MAQAIIAATVSIIVAISGYLATYMNNLKIAQRKDRLDRINRQLAELYGPLLALGEANRRTFEKFRQEYGPDRATPFFDADLTEEERAAWREYVKRVFQPANLRMYEIIVTKSDLLNEAEVPDCLLDLSAHAVSYNVTIDRWSSGDTRSHLALVNFPLEANEYITQAYKKVKAEQQRLLGVLDDRGRRTD